MLPRLIFDPHRGVGIIEVIAVIRAHGTDPGRALGKNGGGVDALHGPTISEIPDWRKPPADASMLGPFRSAR